VKGRVAALAAAGMLAGTGTAGAAFVGEAGSPYPVGIDPLTVLATDFNRDGRPDVAAINGTSSNVSVFLRQPGGGFAQEPGSPIAVGAGPGGAVVGDFNADGLPDIAVTNYQSGSVSVLTRQAGGGFAQQTISLGGGPQAIAAGEFNGVPGTDLVVSLYDAGAVTFLLNNGSGFTQGQTFPAPGNPSTSTVADFDGNGLADVALVTITGNNVMVLLQSAGGFTSEGDIPVGPHPAGIASADFNADGRPDLAVTNYQPGTVSILLRSPGGGFTAEAGSPVAVSAAPVGITAADFDRDGRPDLAVAANSGAIDVLHRNAGGGFTREAIPYGSTPNSVAAADFDGDGRPDIATVDLGTDTFGVLLNPAPPPAPTPTPLPSPVAGKTVNVAPVSGKVAIKRPGAGGYVPLTAGAQIPVGSSIDTRNGRITITAAQAKGKTASADFFDGLFKLTQTKGATPVTTLTLTETLSCPHAASAAAKKPKTRKLWGDGSGSFRTRGQYSAATVRGTRWLVQDSCAATLTRVTRGVVSVQDFVKHKTVVVRAKRSYTARRRG
jgi:FG-GAP-like repeat